MSISNSGVNNVTYSRYGGRIDKLNGQELIEDRRG